MGFFEKLKGGLKKTRENVSGKLDTVLKAFGKIDEDLMEELEDALICADLGVQTTMDIMENLRAVIKEGKIREPAQIKEQLKEILKEMQG